jgi:DegV family protein with EDD domain
MVRIMTDSTCDLTAEQASQLGIDAIAHLYVRFGNETFVDGVTLGPQQFITLLKENPNFPTTSQPSVGDFVKIYEQFKGDPIVSIHISRALSGTIASAEAACGQVGGDITVIDSRSLNAGLTLLLTEAARMARTGASAREIKERIESLVPRTRLNFALETLENLRRGGRIGAAQALEAEALQLKPLIAIKDGKVEPLERVRTTPKAIARLREIALADLHDQPEPQMCFMHVGAEARGRELMVSVMKEKAVRAPLLIEAGPVIATHLGPGTVGIGYIV